MAETYIIRDIRKGNNAPDTTSSMYIAEMLPEHTEKYGPSIIVEMSNDYVKQIDGESSILVMIISENSAKQLHSFLEEWLKNNKEKSNG